VVLAVLVHAVTETPGWQVWHALPGFAAPLAYRVPSIQQPLWQLVELQTWPAPQLAPSALLVHAVSEVPG
jgi:hypothetical protein